MKNFLLLIMPVVLWVPGANAQPGSATYDLTDLQKKNQLEVFNRQASPAADHAASAINLSEAPGDGVAFLRGVTFGNGTIEIDIKGKDVLQQSFVGIAFHGQDPKTTDVVYFRPFNFQTTDPVRRIHAVQYVSHPLYTWDRLRQEKNGQYEKAVSPAPGANDWFHVRIVVHSPRVTVYVNGSELPALSVDKLNDRRKGRIGLWVGNNSGGSFANLKIVDE